jgi:hypothetical protein
MSTRTTWPRSLRRSNGHAACDNLENDMKTICMLVLTLGLIAVAASGGCKVSGEVGDTQTNVSPAR